jgi:hypothetical protein
VADAAAPTRSGLTPQFEEATTALLYAIDAAWANAVGDRGEQTRCQLVRLAETLERAACHVRDVLDPPEEGKR